MWRECCRGYEPSLSCRPVEDVCFSGAALWASLAVARSAEGLAATLARRQAGWHHEMQRIITDQARAFGGRAEVAERLLQPSRQRVPVQMNGALRLPPADLHREPMDPRHKLQRLTPFDRHLGGILSRQ